MKLFFLEITAEDRLSIEVREQNNQLTGLRIKRQAYQKTERVVTDIPGFEPFNTGEWITVVKYDNWKGETIKDAIRPTPAAFSPLGIHVKENWGYLDVYALLERTLEDLKQNWQKDYHNYGTLPALIETRIQHFDRNLRFVADLARYILNDRTILAKIDPELAMIPIPQAGLDDWLIEENANAMTKVEKMALRGKLSREFLGNHQILTHRPRTEGENISDVPKF